MLTKTKIVLATLLMLGTASAALADGNMNNSGGSVMPGSLDGVNPAYHPGIFGNAATARSYGFVQTAHGWIVAPNQTVREQANQ
ncbi:MAG TPA: hypothetical protein VG291_21315 [Xanthobacteraceae bacterium]|jgi:hypothetical protein|nr:hypothetical protein [Xanthobacteraceae bacterium]